VTISNKIKCCKLRARSVRILFWITSPIYGNHSFKITSLCASSLYYWISMVPKNEPGHRCLYRRLCASLSFHQILKKPPPPPGSLCNSGTSAAVKVVPFRVPLHVRFLSAILHSTTSLWPLKRTVFWCVFSGRDKRSLHGQYAENIVASTIERFDP